MHVTEERLADFLRQAEAAHAEYERELGRRDEDWPTWYAGFLVGRLAAPEGHGRTITLDDEELRILAAALRSYTDDFGHEEADVLRAAKTLLAKLHAA